MYEQHFYGDELNLKETARYLNKVSPHTIRDWNKKKKPDLRPYKKKGVWYFLKSVLDEYLLERLRP